MCYGEHWTDPTFFLFFFHGFFLLDGGFFSLDSIKIFFLSHFFVCVWMLLWVVNKFMCFRLYSNLFSMYKIIQSFSCCYTSSSHRLFISIRNSFHFAHEFWARDNYLNERRYENIAKMLEYSISELHVLWLKFHLNLSKFCLSAPHRRAKKKLLLFKEKWKVELDSRKRITKCL